MRTKTLFLTALGSLSALGLMAQTSTNVYSLNAVGYINVVCPPGFSMIADQLIASGGNTIGNVLSDADGHLDGVIVYKWNGTTFLEDSANSLTATNVNNWTANGLITLNPGEAMWFQNPNSTNITNTFVGTVPQGTNSVALNTGFNMASSPIPQSGDLVTDMGLTNFNSGDVVYVYNNAGGGAPTGYTIYSANFTTGSYGYNTDWNQPVGPTISNTSTNYGDPQVAIGQGFWYDAVAPGVNFSRVFSVNQ